MTENLNVTDAAVQGSTEAEIQNLLASVPEEKTAKKSIGRPKFSEEQKKFKAQVWSSVVFGLSKSEAHKALKLLREEHKDNKSLMAVLNSAERSVVMRGKTKAKKAKLAPEVTEAVAEMVEKFAKPSEEIVVAPPANPTPDEVEFQVLKAKVEQPTVSDVLKVLDPAPIQATVDEIIAKLEAGI